MLTPRNKCDSTTVINGLNEAIMNDIERGRTVNVQVPQKNATTPKKHRRTRIFEVSPGILK
jgi:hypothetical protein